MLTLFSDSWRHGTFRFTVEWEWKSELFFLSWTLMFLFALFVVSETFVSDWMNSCVLWAPSRVSWRSPSRCHLPCLHKAIVGDAAWDGETHCVSTAFLPRSNSISFASAWTSSFWNFTFERFNSHFQHVLECTLNTFVCRRVRFFLEVFRSSFSFSVIHSLLKYSRAFCSGIHWSSFFLANYWFLERSIFEW